LEKNKANTIDFLRMKIYSVLLLTLLAVSVTADLYMHNPPGSNDRNRERNDNRNNGDRLFDSQNNGKGGYPWRGSSRVRAAPDPLTYFSGSVLRIEWTSQHGASGNPNVVGDYVIQYGCDTIADNLRTSTRAADSGATLPGLRDGYPDSATEEEVDGNNPGYLQRRFSGEAGQNQQGTSTIPDNLFADDPQKRTEFYIMGLRGGVEFGMHENVNHYSRCRRTTRNRGLYTADQTVNANDARGTRQNPNGARRGLECPEERDYYPYWNNGLNPWCDVAIITTNTSRCDYFTTNSPNVKATGYCDRFNGTGLIPINQADCTRAGRGVWVTGTTNCNNVAPECKVGSFPRDNHLGNVAPVDASGTLIADKFQPETAHYLWTVPDNLNNMRCVLRMRYNMSTSDYASATYSLESGRVGVGIDSSRNCENVRTADGTNVDDLSQSVSDAQCIANLLTDATRPLTNRPYVDVFGGGASRLSIAINTNQAGRTFQDRSYVFDVRAAPVGGKIWNLNVRGRRGNIVQAYPAVEYDFVPTRLEVKQGEYIHMQIHGSNYNEAKNANNGEGWQFADRHNIVQYVDPAHNVPSPRSQISMFPDLNVAQRWALLDQENCKVYKNGDTNEQNARNNCGKLNSAPERFPPNPADGLMMVSQAAGTYYYGSTRNNNFSNRSQKASLIVGSTSGLSAAEKAGIAIGSIAAAGVLFGAFFVYGKKRPNSAAGRCLSSTGSKCQRGGSNTTSTSSTRSTTTAPPDMEYRRH